MTHDSVLARVRASVGAIVVLTLASVGLVVAPIAVQPAVAAAPLTCSPDTVYMLSSSSGSAPWTLAQYTQGGTTITPVATLPQSGVLNALGITSTGIAYYSNESVDEEDDSPSIFRFDPASGATATFSGTALNDDPSSNYPGIRAGAVNPVNGHYYYAHAVSGDQQWDFYAFNATTNSAIGFVGRVDISGLGRVGDIAFDGNGNLYLATSSSSSARLTLVAAADLPTTAQSSSKKIPFSSRGALWGSSIEGLAYVPADATRPLWTMAKTVPGSVIARGTSSTNDSITQQSGMTGGSSVTDMANCATPQGVLTVSKNITGRAAATDQFTLTISPGGATATTTGSANGLQAERALLTTTTTGTVYTVRETAASGSLTNYRTTLVCTNTTSGTPLATTLVSQGAYRFTYPAAVNGVKPNVTCLFTNMLPATLTVTKALPEGRKVASDQFIVQLRTGSAGGTVIDTPGTETTAGVGTIVTPGTGTTGSFATTAGTQYWITEAAAVGTLADYMPRLTCTDAAGLQTGLPTDVAFNPTGGYGITVVEGAQISCVINNKTTSGVGIGQGLTCAAYEVYGAGGTQPNNNTNGYSQLYRVNTITGAATPVAPLVTSVGGTTYYGNTNALAITQGGLFTYYTTQALGSGSTFPVFRLNNVAGVTDVVGTLPVPSGIGVVNMARGGLNPTDGLLWFSGTDSGDDRNHHFWAFNTLTNTSYGYVGTLNGSTSPTGAGGDLAFDQFGNMMFVASTGTQSTLSRISGFTSALLVPSKPTSLKSIAGSLAVTPLVPFAGSYNGITFDNDGYLWATRAEGMATSVARINPNTGTVSEVKSVTGTGSDGRARLITDLADCNDPGALSLRKIIDGRVHTSDQFALEITTAFAGNTAVTSGSTSGLQSAIAGPIVGVPDIVYTLTETMAGASSSPLSAYSTSLQCVDVSHGNAVIPVNQQSQGRYTMTFPSVSNADGQVLGNVVCTYTNTPNATVSLTKALNGARLANSDQFTVQAKIGSSTGAAVGTGTATTTGTGDSITAGTGGTSFTATGGTTYWLGEAAAGTTNLADYPNATITCTDSTARQSGLPSAAPLGSGFTLLPTPGAKIACVITNAVGPAILDTVKTLTHVDGQPITADEQVTEGQVLRYTITTTNTGVRSGTTTLVETVPSGTTYTGSGEGWVCDPASGAALAECGQAITVVRGTPLVKTFTVTVDAPLDANVSAISNTVVSTDGACSACTVTTPVPAEWTVIKTASIDGDEVRTGAVRPGDTIDYTITATASRGQVTDVRLRDVLEVPASTIAATPAATLTVASAGPTAVEPVVTGDAGLLYYVFTPAPFTLEAGQTATLRYSITLLPDVWLRQVDNTVTGRGSVAPQQCGLMARAMNEECSTSHATGALLLIEKRGQGINGVTPLDGAAFVVLSSVNPDVIVTTPPLTATGAVGRFELRGLPAGDYWLRETKAPAGHSLLAADIAFTVHQSGTVTIGAGNPQVAASGTTITVTDAAAYAMPVAGGPGRLPFWIFGALLTGLALTLIVRRRRSIQQ